MSVVNPRDLESAQVQEIREVEIDCAECGTEGCEECNWTGKVTELR